MCEQLPRGHCPAMWQPRVEPMTSPAP